MRGVRVPARWRNKKAPLWLAPPSADKETVEQIEKHPGLGFAATILSAVAGRGTTRDLQEWGARRQAQLGDELIERLTKARSSRNG
jgi:hypothetical protein